jgi:hypothetical protein
MPDVTTEEKQHNTLSNEDMLFLSLFADRLDLVITPLTQRLDTMQAELDHIDEQVHEIHQFIADHKPALAKALSLLDPGKGVRSFLAGTKRKV